VIHSHILDVAEGLLDAQGNLKKSKALDDMSIANLFFEPSTRTRNTFEIAGKRTSANIINVDSTCQRSLVECHY
jgi:aspartate carbamoyltransferase catalytic subunit